MSKDRPKLGCCPSCGTRISIPQAAFYGPKLAFSCRQCRAEIRKTHAQGLQTALAFVVTFFVFGAYGYSSYVPYAVFLGFATLLVLFSLFRNPIILNKAGK